MNTSIYNKVMGLAVAALTFMACSDTWDDHYDGVAAGVEEGSLWQAIKQDANLSNFASVVEACGYDKSLASSQVFTVFAPTNDHLSQAEASELIAAYNAEKGKVSDEDNTVVKEFLQNHIALFNHSVAESRSDSLVLMNGKYTTISSGQINGTPILTSNRLYSNGVLFTVGGQVNYFPNVFEYLRKDADLDSIASFFYNSRYYRKEFVPKKSVAGGFVDGKTVYLDSVFVQQNDLFDYDFLEAILNSEDSTYWMVTPTNEVWAKLVEEYTPFFNYDNTVDKRDSLVYTNPRLAIVKGTIFNRTNNTDKALQDSAFSTSAVQFAARQRMWGEDWLHYYQFGDGTGLNLLKPYGEGGVFNATENIACSNGQVMKTHQWNFNPMNTFYQWIIVEAEGQGSIQELSKVKNTSTNEMEETVSPVSRIVNNDNQFYGMVSGGRFVEFQPLKPNNNHTVKFNIRNVLSNIGYDIYLVSAPALANDSNATAVQRLPTKLRCTLGFNDQTGAHKDDIIQSSITTTPDVVDYLLLAEDYKFPCCSYGLEEDEPQVTLTLETRVSSTEQRTQKFTRTMMIDCIMLVPHGAAAVTDDLFMIMPHADGVVYTIKRK